jgi:hypothetical protein
MARKKKIPTVRAQKTKSRRVWIAPDLERKIKGAGGRRGLTEPPSSYYLHLADLALEAPGSASASARARVQKEAARSIPESVFAPPPLAHAGAPREQAQPLRLEIWMDLIPAPLLPLAPPVVLPALNLPKPPKRPRPPRPPGPAAPKLPKQQQRGKLSLPKPPKRKK